jgi:tetratricopeptide (TPR) repeat protein/predicted Ser/Thr protein kinase
MVDKKDIATDETMASGDKASSLATSETVVDRGPSARAAVESAETMADAAVSSGSGDRERQRIGRYAIVRKLGSGGMGVVYVAEDTDLKRRVVIKLLRADLTSATDSARLQREAQAMAQVSNANVVPVYDVGMHEGAVFLAMEYVEGSDLATWLRQPRRPGAILDVFVDAGRGLAAAHGAGLVHRDFKPHNVLVARDGRVKVTDFGLARAERVTDEAPASGGHAGDLDTPLTRVGSQLGTPAYMAPEQIRGEDVDARADQFAFCVALWEALYKERPFAGATVDELFENVTAGCRKTPPASVRVPAHARFVLERGLAIDPAQRFPDMGALLAVLSPRRKKYLPTYVVVIAGTVIAAGNIIGITGRQNRAKPTCSGGDEEIAAVWNADRRKAIESAFSATNRPDAPAAATALATRFDRLAGDYRAMRREACEATRIHKTQSETVMGLRIDCLGHKRTQLATLVDLFAAGGASAVEQAPTVAVELTGVEACADVKSLAAPIAAPDPAKRRAVGELRHHLAGAEALLLATRLDEAIESGRVIVDMAVALGYDPLIAVARLFAGEAELGLTRYADAAKSLDEAARVAETGKHDAVRARAMTQLVWALRGEGKLEEALRQARLARAVLERAGNEPLRVAQLETELAEVHLAMGDPKAAEAGYRRALEQYQATGAEGRRSVAKSHTNLGHLFLQLRDFDRAFDEFETARELTVELLGDAHPEVSALRQSQALVRNQQERPEEAAKLIDDALATHARYYGPDHPLSFAHHATRGQILQKLGKVDEALAAGTKSADLAALQFGAGHPNHAVMIGALGVTYNAAGRWKEGAAVYERGLAMVEAFHEVPHEDVVIFLNSLGFSLMNAGEHERAVAAHRRALEAVHALELAPGAQLHADTLTRLGAAENARGNASAALPVLVEAMEMRTKAGAAPFLTSWTKFELAKAIWDTRGDRARAKKLAREAHDEAAAAGNEKKRRDIETWLAKH